jgi:phosphoglycerate dehydrogenase-like enzyme
LNDRRPCIGPAENKEEIMVSKIGINGFGRIAVGLWRRLEQSQAKILGINDPFIDPEFMAYIPI